MIKLYDLVLKDSLLGNPFAPERHGIAPLIGAAISTALSAAGAIAQNAARVNNNNQQWDIAQLNAQSVRDTNKSNEAIAERTNYYNQMMMREQNAFNLDMWNKQNAYNHPGAQVQRLLAAGINPATGLGQVAQASQLSSADWAGAQASYNTAPQLDYRPERADLSFIGNLFSTFQDALQQQYDTKTAEAKARSATAQAEIDEQTMQASILDRIQRTEKGSLENAMARRDLKLANDAFDADLKVRQNAGIISDKQIEELEISVATARIEQSIVQSNADWIDKMNSAQYQALNAGIRETYSQIVVNNSEAALKAAQTGVEKAREVGLKISNEQADQLVEIIVDKAEIEALDAGKRYYGGDALGRFAPGAAYNLGGADKYPQKRAVRRAYRQAHRK